MRLLGSSDNKIIHGDALQALFECISDNSIDLVSADPPYNIGKNFTGCLDKWDSNESYLRWYYSWLDLCIQKLKPTGALYVMTSTQFMPYFDLYLRERLDILSRVIWSYGSSGVQARRYFGSLYEPVLFCIKNKRQYTFNASDILVEAKTGAKRGLIDYRKSPPQPRSTTKVPSSVWEFIRVGYRVPKYENHPTQKPVELLERIVKVSSNEGDVVLDPFSGTFTISYAASLLHHKSIGIELQEEYVKIGLRRLGLFYFPTDLPMKNPDTSFQSRPMSRAIRPRFRYNE